MIIIGITGSIGMGKSTIASMLKSLNVPIHDSDKVVKKIIEENSNIKKIIKKKWPKSIFKLKKIEYINKKILSEIVFSQPLEKIKLEKLIHPLVIDDRDKFLRINIKKEKKIVAIDVPLLYETKTDIICNYVFLATASKKKQINRVLKRPNMTIEKFNKINKNQLSDENKKKRNPIIITTQYGKFLTLVLVMVNLVIIFLKDRVFIR